MRFLFKLRPSPNPEAIVYLRIKIDGDTVDLSTGVRVPRVDWDQARQKINGRSVQVHDDNVEPEGIKAHINRLFLLNQDLGARELADLYQEKKPNQYFLGDLVDLFEKDCRAAYQNWETLRTHLTRINNIRQFIQDRKLQKLKAEQINLGMADDFVNWMKVKGRDHQYIVRHTQSLKSITVASVRHQILDVALHPKVLILIDKYGGVENLPKISNGTYNKALKQIQYTAGIEVKLTTKIGRKTFTDIMLNEMHISEEAVAAMLGYSSTRMLKYYGQADNRRIAHEVNATKWDKLKQ